MYITPSFAIAYELAITSIADYHRKLVRYPIGSMYNIIPLDGIIIWCQRLPIRVDLIKRRAHVSDRGAKHVQDRRTAYVLIRTTVAWNL